MNTAVPIQFSSVFGCIFVPVHLAHICRLFLKCDDNVHLLCFNLMVTLTFHLQSICFCFTYCIGGHSFLCCSLCLPVSLSLSLSLSHTHTHLHTIVPNALSQRCSTFHRPLFHSQTSRLVSLVPSWEIYFPTGCYPPDLLRHLFFDAPVGPWHPFKESSRLYVTMWPRRAHRSCVFILIVPA